jgi:hypothetical protein
MPIELLVLVGGILSRGHGAGWLPKVWMSLLWAVIPAVFVFLAYLDAQMPVSAIIASTVCLAGCALGIATGNAPFRDLGTFKGAPRSVQLDFIVKPLHGKIPEYWYDVLGLSVIGLASVSGFVVTMACLNPIAACIVALGGLLKGAAYMIGWAAYPANKDGIATAMGEFLSGMAAYSALGLAVMV